MTNIAICGANGKMGKIIYSCICERDDCKVIGGIDLNTESYADFPIVATLSDIPEKPDVIIDYSHPNSLNGLLEYCRMTGVAVVLATTGYSEEQIAQIKTASEQIPVFFSWNMSLGINLLVELSKKLQQFLVNNLILKLWKNIIIKR